MNNRISLADFAKECGVNRQNMNKQARRHGVTKGADGLYSRAELQQARIVGEQLNRSRAANAANKSEPGSLQAAKLTAQVRKLDVEISILEAERDTALGKLVDVAEAIAHVNKRDAEQAARVSTWREATAAKRPELRREIEELAASLHAMLAEPYRLT